MTLSTNRVRSIAAALLAACSLVAGCATDKQVISQANQMHDGLEPAVIEDQELTDYIQTVGARIVNAAKKLSKNEESGEHAGDESAWMFSKDMRFHFVNSKTLNAFTTGGEHMYIYNELFQQCRNEDELAAVMAHEYGHVYARHVHSAMNRQIALLGAAAAAGAAGYAAGGKEHGGQYAGYAGAAALVAGKFVGMGFSRSDENEADELGFNFYTRAGWDPNRFGDFFQVMIDKGLDKTPAMMSDHPTLASRVAASKERASKLPADADKWRRDPVADDKEFKALQKRAAELGKTLPDDQSLENAQELLAALPQTCLMPMETRQHQEAEQRVIQKLEAGKQRAR